MPVLPQFSLSVPKKCLTRTDIVQSLLLEKVKNGLDLPKDASNREEVFQDIKDKTTAWVAKYRRGAAFQGRPSYRLRLVAPVSVMKHCLNLLLAVFAFAKLVQQSPVLHVIDCLTVVCAAHTTNVSKFVL